jgi:hypothetical protein
VFHAQGLVRGCVNGARKFTPQARVMYLENKGYMIHGWINNARYKWARATRFGEGRGPTWPFGPQNVDGGFGILEYMLVLITPAPRAAHVGDRACKSVGIKKSSTPSILPSLKTVKRSQVLLKYY